MPPRLPHGIWSDFKKHMLDPVNHMVEFIIGYVLYLGIKRFELDGKEKGFAELHWLASARRNAAGKGETSSIEAQSGDEDTRSGSHIYPQGVNPAARRSAYNIEYPLTFRSFNSLLQNQYRSQPSDH